METTDDDYSPRDDFYDDEEFQDIDDLEFITGKISSALALVDSNADLDAVSSAKSVGDAMAILSPNIPGLPTKARGKYLKRRNLNPTEKDLLMKYQNRDNARRTRKRKKLYEMFLKNLVSELEAVLHPSFLVDHSILSQVTIKPEPNINDKKNSKSKQSIRRNSKSGKDDRLDFTKQFLRMRASARSPSEDWTSICCSDVVYTAPCIFMEPAVRVGINGIICDTEYRNSLIEK
eukprot:gene40370-53361_t